MQGVGLQMNFWLINVELLERFLVLSKSFKSEVLMHLRGPAWLRQKCFEQPLRLLTRWWWHCPTAAISQPSNSHLMTSAVWFSTLCMSTTDTWISSVCYLWSLISVSWNIWWNGIKPAWIPLSCSVSSRPKDYSVVEECCIIMWDKLSADSFVN